MTARFALLVLLSLLPLTAHAADPSPAELKAAAEAVERGKKGGVETDIAGVLDQQALPRLDEQTRQQRKDLLDAGAYEHLRWIAPYRP